ncbi:extracellular solute-binding protein [Paenibacillus psychroresistens]|uniref:Extracellular solute-binding protein n=1 Tax=Paenibacillus psychroresistens TaxID=1778678 RepID=A0A6B8RIM6_9BACL|nr:extracellular solute-binding protein [Paenibacillus psychroresistens]QGQ95198.1 extracellular solute-binding protein [Paenibacillus psychroresistens]
MKMKKATLLTASVLLAMSMLTACGTKKAETESASSLAPAATAVATAAPEATAAPGSDPFTLSVYYWTETESKPYIEAAEKKFKEKYPNAKLEYKVVPGAKLTEILNTDLAAGQGADVLFNQSPTVLAKGGYIADLSDQPYAPNMLTTLTDANSFEGKLYGAGLNTATFGVLYNKKIFADLGLAAPKTWDEFLAVCEAIKAKGITPITGGFKDNWTAWALTLPIIENSTYGTHPNFEKDLYDGVAKVNSPEVNNAFGKIEQLAQKGYFNANALSINYDQEQQMFADGKAAMVVFGPWFLADVGKKTPQVDVGFFPLFDENGKSTLISGVDVSLSVNAKSKHIQEAKDYVAILMDKDILPVYLKDKNSLPGIKGVTADYTFPGMQDIVTALSTLPTAPQFQLKLPPSVLNKLIDTVIKTIADKKFDPKDLDQADKLYEKDKSTVSFK